MTRKFCVLTEGRSGSTSLMETLARFDDIAVPGKNIACVDNELLRPRHFTEYARQYSALSGREVSGPIALADAFYEVNANFAYAGFKSMPVRDRELDALVARPDIQFITLVRRDFSSAAASFAVAHFTGTWRRHGEPHAERWRFDRAKHGRWVRGNVSYICATRAHLARVAGAIRLSYESLCDPEEGSPALDEWFGRPVRLRDARPPTDGASVIENWDEFKAFVERTWAEASRPTASRAAPVRARRRVLYAWELGSGIGHVMRFLPLAIELRSRGHEPLLALRDLERMEMLAAKHGLGLFQAPFARGLPGGDSIPAFNYAELILQYGFRTPEGLTALARGWCSLIRHTGAELLIADHSPTALLAARALQLPRCTLGHGFFTPPATSPMPNMQLHAKVDEARLRRADARALANANRALRALGGRPLTRLPDLFEVEETFLTTLPELDHYGPRAGVRYWGPAFNIEEGEPQPWPPGEGAKIFAYIKPQHRDFEAVLAALVDCGARALVYAPGIAATPLQRFSSERIVIRWQPIRLADIRDTCDLAICHAGPGTVAAMLLAGVPLLMLPTNAEQLLSARRVVALGAGRAVVSANSTVPDYGAMLRGLLSEQKWRDAARAFADKYRGFDQHAQTRAIADRVEALLVTGTSERTHAG